jgi:HYDIN/CFA65/VesB-like, Ig-like domain
MASASITIWRAARLGVIAAAAVLVLGASAQPVPTEPGGSTTGTCDSTTGTCDGTTATCVLALDPATVDFGDVVIGDASDQTITVTNNGTGTCGSSGQVEIRGDAAFATAGACGPSSHTVGPAGCLVRVTFSPTHAGRVEASFVLTSSEGRATADLVGVGVDPAADAAVLPPTPPPTSAPGQTTAPTTPTTTTAPTTTPTTAPPTTTATTDARVPDPGVPIADRRPSWPVALALVLVVVLATVSGAVRARRGPRWLRTHLRAEPRTGGAGDVEIVRAHAGLSPPTCVVRLKPRAERGTSTLLEVDR